MKGRKERIATPRRMVILALILVLAGGLFVGSIFFPTIEIEKKEFLGLTHGMDQRAVINMLAIHGVTYALPMLERRVDVTKESIAGLETLRSMDTRICVRNSKKAIDLRIGIDHQGQATKAAYNSSAQFEGLSGVGSKTALLAALRALIEREDGVIVSACIPELRWASLRAISQDDLAYLQQFTIWEFDKPNSHSSAELRFSAGKLARIEYRWRPFEPL